MPFLRRDSIRPLRAAALLLAIAALVLTVAAVRSWRLGAGALLRPQSLEPRYVELWEELRQTGARLRHELSSAAGPTPGRLFSTLRGATEGAGEGLTLLLYDGDGNAVAWGGEGLLHEAPGDVPRTPGPDWRAGVTAATMTWVERLAVGNETWWLVTGRSFATDRLPRRLTPAGELPAAWTLVPGGVRNARSGLVALEAPDLPTLVFEAPAGDALSAIRRARERPWRRGAAALIALALALAAAGSRASGPARAAGISLLALAFLAAAWAGGASWPASLVLALAVAVLAAAASSLGSDETTRRRSWLAAVALALILAGTVVAARHAVSWGTTAASELVCSASLALLAAALLQLVARAVRRSNRVAYAALLAAGVGLAVGGGGALPFGLRLTALVLAVAASGVWLGRWTVHRDWGRPAAAVVLCALAGGFLWSLGTGPSSGVERAGDEASAPSAAELEEEIVRLERRFGRLTIASWRVPDASHRQLQDLALALWRDSPLARRGVLSALTVERSGRAISSFAFGLPITRQGDLDTNPSRWQELELPRWEQSLVEGEGALLGLGGNVRLRYWALLRPGFRSGEPLAPNLVAGLVRGTPDPGRMGVAGERLSAAGSTELRPRRWSTSLRAIEPLLRRQELGRGMGVAARLIVAAAGAIVALVLLAVPPRRMRRGFEVAWSSYSHRLVAVFALLVLATLVPLQAVLVATVSRRMDAARLERGIAALESTQRVLGEYVDSLAPGFGVQTAIDDELLSWLARVIHHEVNIYWESSVYASSRPELFTAGLLPERIPGEIYADLALSGAPVAFRRNRVGETSYLEIYALLRIPGLPSQEKLFLSIPLLAQQEAVAAQVQALRRRTMLTAGTLFLILLAVGTALARSFSGPLQAIVDGTRRIAGGAERLGLRPRFRELATLAEAIDDMASRIGEGRRHLLSEKQLVDRVVDSVTSAVVSLDSRGRVLLCNRVARDLLGAMPGEDLRRALAGRPALIPVLQMLAAAPGAPRVRTVRLPPGPGETEEHEWSVVVTPLPDGGEPSTLLVVEDVTEVLRGQRLQAWAEMARIIAHEIKNPLTPIRLSAEHLREVYASDPPGVGRVLERCVDNILRQVEALRVIASDFATFSRIPRLERQRTDLVGLVRETVAAYERGGVGDPLVELTSTPGTCQLDLDPRLLDRALRNLLENALRAAGAGGRVEVRVQADEQSVSVLVADSGGGVRPETLPRIFDPYFSTREGGTGLGLPISRRIAEEHGGSLVARNHSHLGGLEVELRLPWESGASDLHAGGEGESIHA